MDPVKLMQGYVGCVLFVFKSLVERSSFFTILQTLGPNVTCNVICCMQLFSDLKRKAELTNFN